MDSVDRVHGLLLDCHFFFFFCLNWFCSGPLLTCSLSFLETQLTNDFFMLDMIEILAMEDSKLELLIFLGDIVC